MLYTFHNPINDEIVMTADPLEALPGVPGSTCCKVTEIRDGKATMRRRGAYFAFRALLYRLLVRFEGQEVHARLKADLERHFLASGDSFGRISADQVNQFVIRMAAAAGTDEGWASVREDARAKLVELL
jgi:hypothetical protein